MTRKPAIITLILLLLLIGGGAMFYHHLQRVSGDHDFAKIDRFFHERSLPDGWMLASVGNSRFSDRFGPKWLEPLGMRPRRQYVQTQYTFFNKAALPDLRRSQTDPPPMVIAVVVIHRSGRITEMVIRGNSRDEKMIRDLLLEHDPGLQHFLDVHP